MKNNYVIKDGIAYIDVMCKGELHVVKIDAEDVKLLEGRTLNKVAKRYYGTKINGKLVLLHRLITNCPKGMLVDHLNNDSKDNTRSNLKVCNTQQNNRNQNNKYVSKSGIRNVNWDGKAGKWRVCFSVNNKNKNFGTFDTVEEAKKVADKVRGELYGSVC
jgi:hypothetical protein